MLIGMKIQIGTDLRMRSSLSVLYIGNGHGTSWHRALALERIGCKIFVIDTATLLPQGRFVDVLTWHTGGLFLESFVRRNILAKIPQQSFDLVYVDCGELIGPLTVLELKKRFGTVVNYNIDDPFGARDGRRFRLYLRSVPFYDLIVVVRDCNVSEALDRGASTVLRVHRAADEVAHAPRHMSEHDHQRWATEVAFIGTWMPERGGFMARLVELGVPLSIYGDRWQKAPEWPILRSVWRGGAVFEDDYAKAIQGAKVNLGLLSKGNRDLTTTRSFEIPYMRGVLCAERTTEHTRLYKEDEEAVFWSSPEECAAKCMQLLKDEQRRKRLAIKGRRRCLKNKTTNEAVLAQILDKALGSKRTQADHSEPQINACPVRTPGC
jgi:spore maturation protein CgeB